MPQNFLKNIFTYLFTWERDRKREQVGGGGEGQADFTPNGEPNPGPDSMTLRSYPEWKSRVRGSTTGATQVPLEIILDKKYIDTTDACGSYQLTEEHLCKRNYYWVLKIKIPKFLLENFQLKSATYVWYHLEKVS